MREVWETAIVKKSLRDEIPEQKKDGGSKTKEIWIEYGLQLILY